MFTDYMIFNHIFAILLSCVHTRERDLSQIVFREEETKL